MSAFVFSTYVNEIKNVWHDNISNEDLINQLFNAIIQPLELCDKKGDPYYIDKSVTSRLMNRESNIPEKIKKASNKEAVINSIHNYFSSKILPYIAVGLEAQLINGMKELIINDQSIAKATRERLLKNIGEDTLADFLADLLLYVVKIKNKQLDSQDQKESSDSRLPIQHKYPQLTELLPPTDVADQELPYIRALLVAYADHESCPSISIDSLDQYADLKENFIRQRKNYYAAESVRRGTRDIYTEDVPNQFKMLEDELYDGIIEVWEDDYTSGYRRLNKVMTQAVQVRLDRCWITRDTDWIGASQRKGVCHILVNDNKLKGWLKNNE